MQGYHEAIEHKTTIFTEKPKADVLEEWRRTHPGYTIVHSMYANGTCEIVYTKDVEVEAARLKNEEPDVCVLVKLKTTETDRFV